MIFFIRLFLIGFLWGANPDTLFKDYIVNPFEQKEPEYIPAPDFKLNSISVMRDSSLNNLRFNEYIWNSDIIVKSGFYTNRIRFEEMKRIINNIVKIKPTTSGE